MAKRQKIKSEFLRPFVSIIAALISFVVLILMLAFITTISYKLFGTEFWPLEKTIFYLGVAAFWIIAHHLLYPKKKG